MKLKYIKTKISHNKEIVYKLLQSFIHGSLEKYLSDSDMSSFLRINKLINKTLNNQHKYYMIDREIRYFSIKSNNIRKEVYRLIKLFQENICESKKEYIIDLIYNYYIINKTDIYFNNNELTSIFPSIINKKLIERRVEFNR
jgi:hypothetical protein